MTHLTGQSASGDLGTAGAPLWSAARPGRVVRGCRCERGAGVGLDPGYGHGGVVKVTSPGAPQTSSDEGTPSAYLIVTSFAPATDGSTYALGHENECTPTFACTESTFVERYEIDGSRDESYGDGNAVLLPEEVGWSSVLAGAYGDAVVIGEVGKEIEISRYTADGALDTGFGNGGIVQLPCGCGEAQLHLLNESLGRLLVDEDRPIRFYELGTRVRLTRLDADGMVDHSFGTAGTTRFTVHGAGDRARWRPAGDTTLIRASGQGYCGPRRICLGARRGAGRPRLQPPRHPLAAKGERAQPLPDLGVDRAAARREGRGGRRDEQVRARLLPALARRRSSRGRFRQPRPAAPALRSRHRRRRARRRVFAIGARRSGGYRAFRILAGGRLTLPSAAPGGSRRRCRGSASMPPRWGMSGWWSPTTATPSAAPPAPRDRRSPASSNEARVGARRRRGGDGDPGLRGRRRESPGRLLRRRPAGTAERGGIRADEGAVETLRMPIYWFEGEPGRANTTSLRPTRRSARRRRGDPGAALRLREARLAGAQNQPPLDGRALPSGSASCGCCHSLRAAGKLLDRADELPIRRWQIWNEPNFRLYWAPKIEPAGYAKLLRASATTIRTADPGAKIVLAGIAPVGAGMKTWVFMRRLLKVAGVRRDFDFAAIHPYSANVPELDYQLEKVRSAMVAGGAGIKPLIVTEVGVASWGSYPSAFVEGEDGQASFPPRRL